MGNSRSLLDFLARLAGTVDPTTPDNQLLELFHRTRDDAAFAALVRRHGALVLGVCQRVLRDGKGKFTKLPGALTGMEQAVKPQSVSWGIAVVTDIDNDGVPDLIWNGQYFLWVLRGAGGGAFKYMNPEWGIKDLAASRVDGGLCFGDLDGDGRLDIIGYTSWADQRTSAAYRNELPKRNWLRVRPIGLSGNRGAAGSKIRLYAPGTNQLLWYEQVATYDSQSAQNYYGHAETERHYGLGDRRAADVEVEFYPSGKKVRIASAPANGVVRVSEEAP